MMDRDLHWPALRAETADTEQSGAAVNTDAELGRASLEAALRGRRAVRGFLPEPVPRSQLQRIFDLAQTAPSNCNVQPWRVYIASGAAREGVKAALLAVAGTPSTPDFERGADFHGEYRKHQVECAVALFRELGIERGDVEARKLAFLRNFEFFDAPHVAFIGMHKSFGSRVAIDVGIYLGQLMLLMQAHGLACCPMGSLATYPAVVREALEIPDEIGILVGMAFGFEDPEHPANRTRTTRAAADDQVCFRE